MKQASKKKTGEISGMNKLLVKKLQESTAEQSQWQAGALKKAEENHAKKKLFIERMQQPVACAEMQERLDEEVTKAENHRLCSQVSVVSLTRNAMGKKWMAAEDCKVFQALGDEWWKDDKGAKLSKTLTVVKKSVQRFCKTEPAKKKLWQVSTVEPFQQGDWQEDIVKKGLLMEDVSLLGAVLYGGFLVDKEWVEKTTSLLEKELLLEPLWKLRGSAVSKKLEVCFLAGVLPGGAISPTMSVVLEAKPDRVWQLEVRDEPNRIHQLPESSHWVWRERRDEIRTKDGWVVCGSEGDVKTLEEKKEEKELKVSCLEKDIAGLEEEEAKTAHGKTLVGVHRRLGKKRGELKELQQKLKLMKGQPVTLKQFLEEVVLPCCELCPP